MEKVNLISIETPLTNEQKLTNAHQAIVGIFHATDLDYMRIELWHLLKAVTTDRPFSFQGDPSTVLCLGELFNKMITACRLMLDVAQTEGDDLPSNSFPAFSPQQIAADRQSLRDMKELNSKYGGMIRRLSLAETQRPVLAIKRVFDIYSYDHWPRILEDWVEYGLGKVSICEATGECVEVIQYELLETLLEVIYLIWKQNEKTPRPNGLTKTTAGRAVVELLITALEPELIFEISHPEPSPAEESPYRDLLIVLSDNNHKPFKELEPVIELITVGDEKLGCSVRKLSDLRQSLENDQIYFSLACIPENLVYQRAAAALAEMSPEKMTALVERSKRDFQAGLARAKKFFYGACYYEETNESSLRMFMLQQAIEAVFRTIAISLYGTEKRTHSIKSLKRYNQRLAPQLNEVFRGDSPEEERILQLLEDAYLESRYNLQYQISKEDLDLISSQVVRLLELAESVFEERMKAIVKVSTKRLR
jgi:HEPN domain-containing protein